MIDPITVEWPVPSRVRAVVTTRLGGVSLNEYAALNLAGHVGDDPRSVSENRRMLSRHLDLPAEPAWLDQMHGAGVVDLNDIQPANDAESSSELPEPLARADAAVTTQVGRVAVVMTADCLPVLFSDAKGACVGAAHAGWRGLAAGVLEATLKAMPCAADNIVAWLGPAISQGAYEVDAPVRDAFIDRHPDDAGCFVENAAGRWQANLYALARQTLKRAGVQAIHGGGFCTYLDRHRFFSHRRDGPCGRMASLIWLD